MCDKEQLVNFINKDFSKFFYAACIVHVLEDAEKIAVQSALNTIRHRVAEFLYNLCIYVQAHCVNHVSSAIIQLQFISPRTKRNHDFVDNPRKYKAIKSIIQGGPVGNIQWYRLLYLYDSLRGKPSASQAFRDDQHIADLTSLLIYGVISEQAQITNRYIFAGLTELLSLKTFVSRLAYCIFHRRMITQKQHAITQCASGTRFSFYPEPTMGNKFIMVDTTDMGNYHGDVLDELTNSLYDATKEDEDVCSMLKQPIDLLQQRVFMHMRFTDKTLMQSMIPGRENLLSSMQIASGGHIDRIMLAQQWFDIFGDKPCGEHQCLCKHVFKLNIKPRVAQPAWIFDIEQFDTESWWGKLKVFVESGTKQQSSSSTAAAKKRNRYDGFVLKNIFSSHTKPTCTYCTLYSLSTDPDNREYLRELLPDNWTKSIPTTNLDPDWILHQLVKRIDDLTEVQQIRASKQNKRTCYWKYSLRYRADDGYVQPLLVDFTSRPILTPTTATLKRRPIQQHRAPQAPPTLSSC